MDAWSLVNSQPHISNQNFFSLTFRLTVVRPSYQDPSMQDITGSLQDVECGGVGVLNLLLLLLDAKNSLSLIRRSGFANQFCSDFHPLQMENGQNVKMGTGWRKVRREGS